MKINSHAQLLSSLTSLVDPAQRQQLQDIQDQQNLGKKNQREQQAAEEVNKSGNLARDIERQDRIDANRKALKNLQEKLKADKLAKLKEQFSLENLDGQDGQTAQNLNLRESLGQNSRPQDTRPGQIIDIRV